MTETNRIEYKRELSDGLEKEVIAFLNYREGGIIHIGIDKDGNTYGLADADGDQLKIKDRLKNNIRPSALGLFDIVSEERDGKNILKIIVASGPEKPYHLKKYGMSERGCFIRLGSAAEPMPQKMIDELFASRTRNSIGIIKAHRQDLNFEQLRIYYQEKQKPLNNQFRKNLELTTTNGDLNYAAYLLADENNVSVKVAKYKGETRVDLIESNEYGYCSLIKATKSVLDKINLENRTITQITPKERKEQRLWNAIALREAILNAFVHNDYTREIAPKFEIFRDRLEITSAGSLPDGLSKSEFFEGYSIPRNKELMRVYKDLDLVEQLGSGIPRILEHYDKDSFHFSDNFLRMVLPSAESVYATEQVPTKYPASIPQVTAQDPEHVNEQVTEQVKNLLSVMDKAYSRKELMEKLKLTHREHFRAAYIQKAIELGFVELTLPDKPKSSKQQYRLTEKGKKARKGWNLPKHTWKPFLPSN